ncbi:MAG: hypothetical protein M3A44_06930 [Gammaproteobacteria bacterium]
MDTPYDLQAWADATTRGRRLYNYNYRMSGDELRGWELINVVPMENTPRHHETVYLWEKKGSDGQELVRIGIAEADDWRAAQSQLHEQLRHSMRPDIPRGAGKLAAVGDVNYAGQEPGGTRVASLVFSLGNVSITISSVGDKTVDVSAIAQRLDHTLGEPPAKEEIKAGKAERLTTPVLKVKKGQTTTLIECLPERESTGWHKLIVPDGELKREDDAIVYVSPSAGEKKIERYQVGQ